MTFLSLLPECKRTILTVCSILVVCLVPVAALAQAADEGWHLIWNDEFDGDGRPDSTKWGYEQGFVRNDEPQWYAPENAFQRDGHLVIEARPANFPCPAYQEGNRNWLDGFLFL